MFRASWTLLFSCKYLLQIRTNGVYQMPLGFILQTPFKKKRGNRVAGMDTALYTHILLTLNKWNKEVVITSLPWRGKSVFLKKKKNFPGGFLPSLFGWVASHLCVFFPAWKIPVVENLRRKKNKKQVLSHFFGQKTVAFDFGWLHLLGKNRNPCMVSAKFIATIHRRLGIPPGFSGLALIRLQPWISMTFKPTHFQPLKTRYPWEEAFFVCIPRDVSPIWRCVCLLMNVFEPNKFVGWMYSKGR